MATISYTYYKFKPPFDIPDENQWCALKAIPHQDYKTQVNLDIISEKDDFISDNVIVYNVMRFGLPFIGLGWVFKEKSGEIASYFFCIGIISWLISPGFTITYASFLNYLRKKKKFLISLKKDADSVDKYGEFAIKYLWILKAE